MAHQTLRIQWFGNTWFTKLYKYNGVRFNGSPNNSYTMVWKHMDHQIVPIQLFDGLRLPNITYTFGDAWLAEHYKYICLIAQGLPSITYTMVRGRIVHKKYKYKGLKANCSSHTTYTMV